ncbi:hypothetical protein [Nonomuraea sp. C10]|uniref:hypothetical protein n=1 Tax=Nonomuraea sp. C10 TaxID=2600577 RepID=UPI0011CE2FFC|nr:hypothetical protein [Nonomuraea sp. C10]TXK41192.1 hypothetical protein FR742_17870 [Nonomuraea sp. C10]
MILFINVMMALLGSHPEHGQDEITERFPRLLTVRSHVAVSIPFDPALDPMDHEGCPSYQDSHGTEDAADSDHVKIRTRLQSKRNSGEDESYAYEDKGRPVHLHEIHPLPSSSIPSGRHQVLTPARPLISRTPYRNNGT